MGWGEEGQGERIHDFPSPGHPAPRKIGVTFCTTQSTKALNALLQAAGLAPHWRAHGVSLIESRPCASMPYVLVTHGSLRGFARLVLIRDGFHHSKLRLVGDAVPPRTCSGHGSSFVPCLAHLFSSTSNMIHKEDQTDNFKGNS